MFYNAVKTNIAAMFFSFLVAVTIILKICYILYASSVSYRLMILTGLVAIAQHLGPARVEAELLPQCWEQVSFK